VLILSRVILLADGRVNACDCMDVNGSLIIGDIKKNELSYILSSRNPLYTNLIQEQMKNQFRSACKSCDIYRSIYAKYGTHPSYYDLDQVMGILDQT